MRSVFQKSAIVIVGAVALASCSSNAAESKSEPSIPDVAKIAPIARVADVHLPLARYLSPASDEDAFFAAIRIEKQKCAAEFGVVSTEPPVSGQPAEIEQAVVRRYGVVDSQEVRRYGYQPVGDPDSNSGGQSKKWSPDSREYMIMQGQDRDGKTVMTDPSTGKSIPDHGCNAEAFRRLREGKLGPGSNALVDDLLSQAWSLTIADSRALKVQAEWSACMKAKGYDFKARWDAGNSVADASLEIQRQMAIKDLDCAEKTNYIAVWNAVDAAYQDRLISDNETDLKATQDGLAKVMSRVNRTLAGQ